MFAKPYIVGDQGILSVGTKCHGCTLRALVLDAFIHVSESERVASYIVMQCVGTTVRCVPYIVYRGDMFTDLSKPFQNRDLYDVFGLETDDMLWRRAWDKLNEADQEEVPPEWSAQIQTAFEGFVVRTIPFGVPVTTRSSRVCVSVDGTQEYVDVASINAQGNTRIANMPTPDVQIVTEQLCKYFWDSAWIGADEHDQGAMCRRRAMPPECRKLYSSHVQGVLRKHTHTLVETPKYPDSDLSAIVLSTDVSGFDEQERNPGYLAFYNVLQYSQSSNILRCLLYILYARDTYPTGITSTIMQPYGEARAFRRRAEGVLIRNISDKTVPLQWIDLFKRALEGLQHNDDTVLFGI